MKKFIIEISMTLITTMSFAQEKKEELNLKNQDEQPTESHEIKFNLGMAVFSFPELSYEYFLEDNMGLGVSLGYSFADPDDFDLKWQIIPHYRLYFGKKRTNGFFIEGNLGLYGSNVINYESYYNPNLNNWTETVETKYRTDFGFGSSVGFKLLTKNNFAGEINAGIVKSIGSTEVELIPRLGVSLTKRF